jgi:hypothetical protein
VSSAHVASVVSIAGIASVAGIASTAGSKLCHSLLLPSPATGGDTARAPGFRGPRGGGYAA